MQLFIHPPCNIFQCRAANLDDLVGKGPLYNLSGQGSRFAEGDDFCCDTSGSKIGNELLRGDETLRQRLSQCLLEMLKKRMGQTVGGTDEARHVEADPFRISFLDELLQRVGCLEQVIGVPALQEPASDP